MLLLLPPQTQHAVCTRRPYPITTAAIMTSERTVSPKFFPWEFTPLYVGMAPVAQYNKPTALGGGFVEAIAFDSTAPRRKVVSKTGGEVSAHTAMLPQELCMCIPIQHVGPALSGH